jgi:prepilin-type N-terminal cleavage/methylation domain-containing protein
MKCSNKKSGFTLIEVVVALAILGLVLGGAISTVNQYADQRGFINTKMIGSQVAWNVLVDQYRRSENWVVKSGYKGRSGDVKKGVEKQNGQRLGLGIGYRASGRERHVSLRGKCQS